MIIKICKTCGKTFSVWECRKDSALYCCRECANKGRKALPNVICDFCGKHFYMKKYQQLKYKRTVGIFCSKKCFAQAKKIAYKGENNHQYNLKGPLNASFNGLEISQKNYKNIDIMVYCPTHSHANTNGRVKKHRLVVEQNYNLFDDKYFENINGQIVLKKGISVHHKDGNHNNNDITNLMPCTRSEHKNYHKSTIISRNSKGQIIKTAVLKQGELLESPEVGNQQPSQPLTKLEGSETNS